LSYIKHNLERLDINVAYACNISCAGCISLSNFSRKGVAKLNEIASWIDHWHQYLNINTIVLFGGEPLVNPDIIEICQLIRKYYPTSVLRLITNGYLLDRIDPNEWFKFMPFEIQVSVHRLDHEHLINEQIKKILKVRSNWKTIVHSGTTQHQQIEFLFENLKIYKSKFKEFIAPYNLINNKLLPFHSDPAKAHSLCGSPATPILYKGQLYKCPAVANLIDYTGENWTNYQECHSPEQLSNFVANIGRPESVCSQCPENLSQHSYNHFELNNVEFKKKTFS
jgi:organic radical activating enzyme